MATVGIGDISAIAVAGVTLVVTCLLVIIAIRIGSEVREIYRRVESVEARRLGDTRELHAIQALMEIFRRQSEANFKMIYTLAISEIERAKPITSTSLEEELERYKNGSDRYLVYLLLLKENVGEQLMTRLSNVVNLYTDETTIEFLQVARLIVPEESHPTIDSAIREMKHRVRGYDSFYWTGRS